MEFEKEDIYDKIIIWGLAGLIVFTPLPKGSVGVGYFSMLELSVFVLFAVWCLKTIRRGSKGSVRYKWGLLFIFPLLLISLVVFQLIPLPLRAIKSLSPQTGKFYENLYRYNNVENVENTVRGLNKVLFPQEDGNYTALPFLKAQDGRQTLSLYDHNTREYLFKLLAYMLAFFLVIQTIRTREQARTLIYAAIFTGFALATLSIIQKYSYNGKALWIWKPITAHAHPYGPFVNRNHFAGYINLLIPLGIGMAMYEAERVGMATKSRLKVLKRILFDEKGSRAFVFVFVSIIMAVALFLSLSRGGMISFVGALFFMSLLLVSRRSIRRRAVTIVFISCILGLITWFGWDPIIHRLETFKYLARQPQAEWRLTVWRDTIEMFKNYPLFGTGIGTYSNTFPMYKSDELFLTATHPENDYLQILSEGGIIGAATAALFLVIFFFKGILGWKDRHNRFIVYAGLGCLVGMVAFLMASIFNFNFHLPANALLFMVFGGLCLSMVKIKSEYNKINQSNIVKGGLFKKYVIPTLLLAVISFLSIQVVKVWMADIYHNRAISSRENRELSTENRIALLKRSIDLNPINSDYRLAKARLELTLIDKVADQDEKIEFSKMVIDDLKKAASLEPTNGYYWMYLAWATTSLFSKHALAHEYFKKSIALYPSNYVLHEQYALWAFSVVRNSSPLTGKKSSQSSELLSGSLPPTASRQELMDIAVREYRTASFLNHSLVEDALHHYSEFTRDPEKLRSIVPENYNGENLIRKIFKNNGN